MRQLPEGSMPVSSVTIVNYLDPDGTPMLYLDIIGINSTVEMLGILERAKFYLMSDEASEDA
jgi:hypothetical protein